MTAHLLKYKYGMNPLTCTWAPHIYTSWGWENFQAWIDAGFDNILYTPNSKIHRIITRLSTEKLFYGVCHGRSGVSPRFTKRQVAVDSRVATEAKFVESI